MRSPLGMTVYYLRVDARTYRLVFLTPLHRQPLLAPTFDAIARTFSVP